MKKICNCQKEHAEPDDKISQLFFLELRIVSIKILIFFDPKYTQSLEKWRTSPHQYAQILNVILKWEKFYPIRNRPALRHAPLLRLLPPLRPPHEAVAPKPAAKQPNVLLQGAALLQQGAGDQARRFPNKKVIQFV